jgi:ATP-dependent Clp protease adaptor protein ClpS
MRRATTSQAPQVGALALAPRAATEQAPQVDAPPAPPPATPAAQPQTPAPSGNAAPSKTPPQRQPLEQYKVLLHNDEHNEMMYVVQSIVQIAHVPTKAALGVMLEAHRTGVALVAVTHLELAELYRDQFKSKGLTATIEKA